MALASIAGVALLAGNMQTQLAKESGTTRAPIVVNNQLVNANLAAPAITVNGGGASGGANRSNGAPSGVLPASIPGTLSACVQGLCANFPLINGANDRIDVAAGNGGDRILQFSRALMQMAQSVEENMKDPGLAAQIRQLASTGHTLGDLQNNVMANSTMSTGISKSTPLRVLRGQGSRMLDGYQANANNFNAQYNALTQAMNARGGKLPDPVKSLIAQNAQQIQRISGGLTKNASFGSAINIATVQLTHQSANGICAGQSSQTCIRRGG